MSSAYRNTGFYARHLGALLPVIALLAALGFTDLDRTVTGWFYDPQLGEFPWRYNGFLEVVMHHGVKYAVALIAVTALALYLVSFIIESLKPLRSVLLFVALALILAPSIIALLKLASARHCPWNIVDYGGFAPYLKLLDPAPSGITPGHCFPAGHASTGFCLMAFYFVGHALGRRRLAVVGLGAGLTTGLILGFVRIMQGAHFVSHVLWSGVVCWLIITLLYGLIVRPFPIPTRGKAVGAYPSRA